MIWLPTSCVIFLIIQCNRLLIIDTVMQYYKNMKWMYVLQTEAKGIKQTCWLILVKILCVLWLASPCNNLNTYWYSLTVGYHTPVFGLNRIKVTAFYIIMFSKRWLNFRDMFMDALANTNLNMFVIFTATKQGLFFCKYIFWQNTKIVDFD